MRRIDDFAKIEGGIRFAAPWTDQERLVMLTVLENVVGEMRTRLSKGSAPLALMRPLPEWRVPEFKELPNERS